MSANADGRTGVLLLSFGTASSDEDVPRYLAHVRAGRPVPPALVEEFQARFRRIGGSPLLRITLAQAAALEDRLRREPGLEDVAVGVGMRHAAPFIADALRDLVEQGVGRVVAVVLSPQFAPAVMAGYLRDLEEARAALGDPVPVAVAASWAEQPDLLDALAERVTAALDGLPAAVRGGVPVVFTSHSLPRSVVDREPGYLEQLRATAEGVASRTGLERQRWRFAYQSAGRTAEEWLTPDVVDLLPELRAAGHRHVLVVPVQFLADHLEVLYDLDVDARERAEALGMTLVRSESLNTAPRFVEALAQVVLRTLPNVAAD